MQQIVLGLGTGQCGFYLLFEILRQQFDSSFTFEEPPVLPWLRREGWPGIRERIARWKSTRNEQFVGDVAAFYLPYVEEAIQCEPTIRIVCLTRPRQEVIDGFCRELDAKCPVATNHWSRTTESGMSHDPIWTRTFPQYEQSSREAAIGLYWDDYQVRITELARRFPANLLIIDADSLLSDDGVKRLLNFVQISRQSQRIVLGKRSEPSSVTNQSPRTIRQDPLDPHQCVVLVPHGGMIHAECEESLKELERRGYAVRRVSGYAAVDQARNQMATDALIDGYQETMWIDSDIGFHADDVERLRAHHLPIVSGIYPQKGKRTLASHIVPGTPSITFGAAGGLVELLFAATGFLLVRRQVYLDVQENLSLPVCNERFGRALMPFFLPMIHRIDDGHWYLAEDFAFSERARQVGHKIYADTRIRLWHVGHYSYGWEDAGIERSRFDTFTLNFDVGNKRLESKQQSTATAISEFARQFPWPEQRPEVLPPVETNWLFPDTRRALTELVSRDATLILEIGSWLGRSTRFLCDLAPKAKIIAVDHWKGSPEHFQQPDLARLLPRLYETFQSESWDYRDRIIPVRAGSVEGMQRIAAAGLAPDLIYIDADHSYESVLADVTVAMTLFPSATLVGDDFNWDGVKRALERISEDRKLQVKSFGSAWCIMK